MKLSKYSFGIGDRFAQQGMAQLQAFIEARNNHMEITPVWNKSFREHKTVKSSHRSVREEADSAVEKLQWQHPYLVDADHITLGIVDDFIPYSDFFTIDVADAIGQKITEDKIHEFVKNNLQYIGNLEIPGISEPFEVTEEFIWHIGERFLLAASEASLIFQHLNSKKGVSKFIAEVSMDEVKEPQNPAELFFILSALSFYGVKPQTIAPKFTGRFNKGVDYVGDLKKFEQEFEYDLLVIDHAIKEFDLPGDLKLSVHSGSDKFSIYPIISEYIKKHNRGIHIKTAGTTWLEEVAGLALSGKEALDLAKAIYERAFHRFDELTAPYSSVIDIDMNNLPHPETVQEWDGQLFAASLRHDQARKEYNPDFRQVLHVGYKIAAEMGDTFINLVRENDKIIAPLVTENIYQKHIKPLFVD